MKKNYQFSKFFVPAVILSTLLIIAGIISVVTKGFNKGLDFAPGQSIEVSISNEDVYSEVTEEQIVEFNKNTAKITLSYQGEKPLSIDFTANGGKSVYVTVEGSADAAFAYADCPDFSSLVSKVKQVVGSDLTVDVEQNESISSEESLKIKEKVVLAQGETKTIYNTEKGERIVPKPVLIKAKSDIVVSQETVEKALASLGKKIEVKAVENDGKVFYQIRTTLDSSVEEAKVETAPASETAVAEDASAENAVAENAVAETTTDTVADAGNEVNKEAKAMNKDEEEILAALSAAFGEGNVVEIQATKITAQYSSTLIRNSIILVLATLVLIFIYAAFRFKWDFALAAVIAIIHDALIMVSFISITGLEFTTTTIAAILTIIGYSINATVVILDRVRSDLKTVEAKTFKDILNSALNATLSRSLITTVTTLFAVLSLVYFTTGDIHNFAVALVVGLISGCYSSMFIAGAFINLTRKNWRPVTTSQNVVKFEE